MGDKQRADLILFERGLVPSRERAKAAIMAGKVKANGQTVKKAGDFFDATTTELTLVVPEHPFVGRGGLKLEKAINTFALDLREATVLDVGASTGGFTDCALQNGAAHVYALDVGYGQLAWKLRQDPRVTVLERTNIRTFSGAPITELVDGIVIDVSFISLRLVIPHAVRFLKKGGWVVALVKPQFEAGREKVGKGGIVRDADVHIKVLDCVFAAVQEIGLQPIGLDFSPITGADGNIEYLSLFSWANDRKNLNDQVDVIRTVSEAFDTLRGLN